MYITYLNIIYLIYKSYRLEKARSNNVESKMEVKNYNDTHHLTNQVPIQMK